MCVVHINFYTRKYTIMELFWLAIANWNNIIGLLVGIITIGSFIYLAYSRLYNILRDIRKEFFPNGGSSLRDRLDKMDAYLRISLRINSKPFMIFNKEGKCTDVSEELCSLYSYTPHHFYGNGWLAGVDDQEKEKILDYWHLCLENKIEFNYTYTSYTASGKSIQIKDKRVPMLIIREKQEPEFFGYFGSIEQV